LARVFSRFLAVFLAFSLTISEHIAATIITVRKVGPESGGSRPLVAAYLEPSHIHD
jgi:hypothetical protein